MEDNEKTPSRGGSLRRGQIGIVVALAFFLVGIGVLCAIYFNPEQEQTVSKTQNVVESPPQPEDTPFFTSPTKWLDQQSGFVQILVWTGIGVVIAISAAQIFKYFFLPSPQRI